MSQEDHPRDGAATSPVEKDFCASEVPIYEQYMPFHVAPFNHQQHHIPCSEPLYNTASPHLPCLEPLHATASPVVIDIRDSIETDQPTWSGNPFTQVSLASLDLVQSLPRKRTPTPQRALPLYPLMKPHCS